MATFKTVVRKKRADGFYPVYIRIVHRSRMGYIKTDKLITGKQISKSGEIKDAVVNEYCSRLILHFTEMINRHDISNYSVIELIEYLTRSDEDVHEECVTWRRRSGQQDLPCPSVPFLGENLILACYPAHRASLYQLEHQGAFLALRRRRPEFQFYRCHGPMFSCFYINVGGK